MSYNAEDNYPAVDRVFAPCLYSEPTLTFIREHLGENPTVALNELTPEVLGIQRHQFRDVHGKNNKVIDDAESQYHAAFLSERKVIEQALRRFYDLDDLQEHDASKWVGVESVAQGIDRWIKRQEAYRKNKKSHPQGKGHHPELYLYDQRGRRYSQGPGSDAGRPRRYDIALFDVGVADMSDFTKDLDENSGATVVEAHDPEKVDAPDSLREGEDFLGCPVCSYQVQYDPESRDSYNRGVFRVKAHMRAVRKDVDDHQEALLRVESAS